MPDKTELEDWGDNEDVSASKLNAPHKLLRSAFPFSGGKGVRVYTSPGGGTAIAVDETPQRGEGLFPVSVTQDGGSAGSKTTQCTFTYTATRNGVELGTGLSPQKPRPLLGKHTEATIGSGSYEDGAFVLYDVGEVPTRIGCP